MSESEETSESVQQQQVRRLSEDSESDDGAEIGKQQPEEGPVKRPREDDNDDNEPQPHKAHKDGHGTVVASHYNKLEERGLHERTKSRIFYMRNFNNWIKSILINRYLNRIKEKAALGTPLRVMDMCCGKGGDLLKWSKGNITHLICTDIAEVSVEQCEARYKNIAQKGVGIYLIGGTIPERNTQENKIYNTCTVWSPEGTLMATYRKIHLFDINIPGGITFRESDVLTGGSDLAIVPIDGAKIGIGICYDIRFDELARLYRNQGCDMLIYPGAFNMKTGPLHWELLARARANDTQSYIATISPARDAGAGYVAWGHSMVVDPWAKVVASAKEGEETVVADVELKKVDEVRAQIPIFSQRRTDLYDTKKQNS